MKNNFFYSESNQPFIECLAQFLWREWNNDFSSHVIILPSKRGCLALKNALITQASGRACLLPKIKSLSELSDLLPYHLIKSNLSHKILTPWEQFTFLKKYLKQSCFLKEEFPKTDSSQMAHFLMKILNEMFLAGVEIADLVKLIDSADAYYYKKNLNFLKEVFQAYASFQEQSNKIDPRIADQYVWEALSLYLPELKDYKLIIAGFTNAAVPSLAKMIKKILNLPFGMVILPSYESHSSYSAFMPLKKFIHYLKADPQPLPLEKPPHTKKVLPHYVEVVNDDDQAKLISLIIRYHLQESEDCRITVVCPSQRLLRLIVLSCESLQISVNSSFGIPFNLTPAGELIRLIINLIEKGDIKDFLALCHHPFIYYSNIANRKILLEEARAFEQEIRNHKKYFWKLKDLNCQNIPYPSLKKLLNDVKSLNPKNFITYVHNWVENLFSHSSEHQDIERLSDFLIHAKEVDSLITLKELFSFIPNVQPKKGLGSRVNIVGILEARLTNTDVIIVASLTQDYWPTPLEPNPFLSTCLRKKLGILEAEERNNLYYHDFIACLAFNKVYLICPLKDSNNEEMVKSPFLANILYQTDTSWHEILNPICDTIYEYHPSSAYYNPSLECRPKRYSATDIEMLIKNSYAYYLKRILKIKNLQNLKRVPQAAEQGNFIHMLLANWKQHTLSRQEIENILLENMEKWNHHPHISIFWEGRFRKIMEWMEQKRQEKYENLVEQEGEITLQEINASIFARVDLIQYNDKELKIIDYKTGRLPSLKEIELGFSPQIPLEMLIAYYGGYPCKGNKILGEFWHLPSQSGKEKILTYLLTEENLKELRKKVSAFLERFINDPAFQYVAWSTYYTLSFNDYEFLSHSITKKSLVNAEEREVFI